MASSSFYSCLTGHGPRLSEANLFTLLSLWMELFPQERPEDEHLSQVCDTDVWLRPHIVTTLLEHLNYFLFSQVHRTGLVVVRDSRVLGLHCSGPELHAGQVAIISHGADLADCQLYFSRRPCATCLKMLINGEANCSSF